MDYLLDIYSSFCNTKETGSFLYNGRITIFIKRNYMVISRKKGNCDVYSEIPWILKETKHFDTRWYIQITSVIKT